MAEEVRAVLGSGKTLKIGDETWVITDPGTRIEFVDFITEARHFNGVVYVSFANSIIDMGNAKEAAICSRLRMNLGVAQNLHAVLGDLIRDALKPTDQSKAN